jgi:uncharacterized protein YrrD
MRFGKQFIGKSIVSVKDGVMLGAVKDLYLDSAVRSVVGLYLGGQGLLSRRAQFIDRDDVVLFGVDAVLARDSDVVTDTDASSHWTNWVRRDKVQGRLAYTAGGTKVAMVDDVMLDDNMYLVGFSLSRVYIEGPVAEKRAVALEAVIEVEDPDGVMIIDLSKAEQQVLSAV